MYLPLALTRPDCAVTRTPQSQKHATGQSEWKRTIKYRTVRYIPFMGMNNMEEEYSIVSSLSPS